MLAELQSTFGGDPLAWLHMPWKILQSYLRWRPRIEAQRTLAAYTANATAAGNVPPEDARAWLRELERKAQEGYPPEQSVRGDLNALAAMGIAIERV